MTKVEIIELYIRDLESQVGKSPARDNRINMLKEELNKALTLTSVSKSLTTEEQELEDMIKPLRGKCLGKKLRGEW